MASESMGGLEDLMMGNVSEEASESQEQFAERVRAAQARMAKIARDEKKAKSFDKQLADLIGDLDDQHLSFVVFLVDSGVPSLTILALIALNYNAAGQICYKALEKDLAKEKFSLDPLFTNKKAQQKASVWLLLTKLADGASDTLTFEEIIKTKKDFKNTFLQGVEQLIEAYVVSMLPEEEEDTEHAPEVKKLHAAFARTVLSR